MDFGVARTAEPVLGAEPVLMDGPEPEPLGFRPLEARMSAGELTPLYASESGLDDEPPSGWPVWLVAVAVSALWALAPIAFAVGYRSNVSPLQDDRFALAVFALLAIGPAFFVLGAAYMIRQGQRLAWEARRARAMAEDMLSPAMVAAARAGHVASAIREEIAHAGAAADEAGESLKVLRDALALETESLTGATARSIRTAEELASTLGRERSEMAQLAQTLDVQASKVDDAISRQAKMVSEAAGLAAAQIQEAESTLAARAADLAAAAGEAGAAARTAGEDLTRHIARLETAGVGVADQVRAVESGLGDQRAALLTLAETLKADNAAFTAEADAHAAKLAEFIEAARTSATEMAERATAGGGELRQLMTDAALHFRDLAETAKAEREEFGQSTLQSLDAVATAAGEQRAKLEAQTRAAIDALAAAAEETRAAAARHAATARDQVDQLSEAAFAAGQKANEVFEARLEEARALVEQSSKLVEDAGADSARRLEEGAAAARATLDELAAMLGEIETRAARLPVAARGQAEQVRAAVVDGVEALMEQARRTAAEAQAIDAAFQERVRRNFEMLSEAVRLMGAATTQPALAPTPRAAPDATPPAVSAAGADPLDIRPRLRLTPTATDAEFSAVFAAAGGPAGAEAAGEEEEDAEGGDAWTWKDLLASLDGEDGEGERLEAELGGELDRMGVDPAKLLPRARIDEIAAAVQTGDSAGAREVVRKLAPAATRRIARRLLTDEDVRRKTEVYTRRFQTLLTDAAVRDPEGFMLADLLGEDSGRLYLLLDAAVGDLD